MIYCAFCTTILSVKQYAEVMTEEPLFNLVCMDVLVDVQYMTLGLVNTKTQEQ